MMTEEQLFESVKKSYLNLKGQGISNDQSLHHYAFCDGYSLGWKESKTNDYSLAFKLQEMIDDCDMISIALLNVRGHGCAELSRMRGKQRGLEAALELMFPEYKNKRVFLLNEEKYNKTISDLVKQFEDADHEQWIKEERAL